jgi:hypothetical protein
VRANGLARVQKPNISGSRVSVKGKSLDSNYSYSQPIFQNGFGNQYAHNLQNVNQHIPGSNHVQPFHMNERLINFNHL